MDIIISLMGFGFCIMLITGLAYQLLHFAAKTIGFALVAIVVCKLFTGGSETASSIKNFIVSIAKSVQLIDFTSLF